MKLGLIFYNLSVLAKLCILRHMTCKVYFRFCKKTFKKMSYLFIFCVYVFVKYKAHFNNCTNNNYFFPK